MLSRWRLGLLPSLRDRTAGDQGLGHRTEQNRPTPHVPQPLLHSVRRLRASQALTDCEVALLTEQARGGVRQV